MFDLTVVPFRRISGSSPFHLAGRSPASRQLGPSGGSLADRGGAGETFSGRYLYCCRMLSPKARVKRTQIIFQAFRFIYLFIYFLIYMLILFFWHAEEYYP